MPKLLKTPFAIDAAEGFRTDIQESTGAAPNSATYQVGFPPVTMQSIASNGMPPKGSDLNGVLYDITDNLVFLTQGGGYGFDSAYATSIGGYPLNARLRLTNGDIVKSTIDGNVNDPNVDMTGWVNDQAVMPFHDASNAKYLGGIKESNTALQNDLVLQHIINLIESEKGGVLWIPSGVFEYSHLTPKSNVTIDGVGTLKQIQPSANIYTGFNKPKGIDLVNFKIKNINLDGNRIASPLNPYNPIINIEIGATDTVENISVLDTKQKNAQEHFIRVVAKSVNAKSNAFKFNGNSFETTQDKWSLVGASVVSLDAVRFEQIPDAYGVVNFDDIEVNNNTAKYIRTLADIKRGCANWVVNGNHTEDMYDCHHSADGSFNGVFSNNTGKVNSSTTVPSTFTNFIEIQGEHISAHDNIFNGGGKVVQGILITDYGRPSENGIGYQSIDVNIHDNSVSNVTSNAYKSLNAVSCKIVNNHAENAGAHLVAIDSGTGRKDANDNLLTSKSCIVDGNTGRNVTLGVKISGTNHIKGINTNANNSDDVYYSTSLASVMSSAFINKYSSNVINLNPELLFDPTITVNNNLYGFSIDYYPAAVKATTLPDNSLNAITLEDESTTVMRIAFLKNLVPAKKGDIIYIEITAKQNTATNCSVLVQEYSGDSFVSNNFKSIPISSKWVTYVCKHVVTAESATHLRIGIVPAASSNIGTTTGKTDFACFKISRNCPSIR